jgi:hypothetical protein
MSRCLFSFVTWACSSRPFYALWATPKTALNFGRSVSRLVCRSQGSHMNVTLPLQFCHPGLLFPTLLRPAGHPQNSFKFWLVGRSVGHKKVTQMSRCLFSFVTWARSSRPFYALRATPKTALNFGWSVGRLVCRSQGSHTNVTLPLQFRQPGLRLSRPFYALRATPKTAFNFGRSVGRSVGRLVTGKSHKHHSASSVSSPGPALPDPSTPCWATPKTALSFGWLVGWSIGRSVGHGEVTRTSCCLFSFGTQARPSRPFSALRATPKRP